MKHLIIALIAFLISCSLFAQNGGQANENGAGKIEYIGVQAGQHYALVTNKLNMQAIFRIEYMGQFTEVPIAANSSYAFSMGATPTSLLIKAKNLQCGGNDCGWVELVLTGLPVKFIRRYTQRIDATHLAVYFEIAEATNVKQFNVRYSFDGKTKHTAAIVWPDELQPNRLYKAVISLPKKK